MKPNSKIFFKVSAIASLASLTGCHHYIVREDHIPTLVNNPSISKRITSKGWHENACDPDVVSAFRGPICASKDYDIQCKTLGLFPSKCTTRMTATIYRTNQSPENLKYTIFKISGRPPGHDDKVADIAAAELKVLLSE